MFYVCDQHSIPSGEYEKDKKSYKEFRALCDICGASPYFWPRFRQKLYRLRERIFGEYK